MGPKAGHLCKAAPGQQGPSSVQLVGKQAGAQKLEQPVGVGPDAVGHLHQAWDDACIGLVRQVPVQAEQHVLHAVVRGVLAAVGRAELALPLEQHLQHEAHDLHHKVSVPHKQSVATPMSVRGLEEACAACMVGLWTCIGGGHKKVCQHRLLQWLRCSVGGLTARCRSGSV